VVQTLSQFDHKTLDENFGFNVLDHLLCKPEKHMKDDSKIVFKKMHKRKYSGYNRSADTPLPKNATQGFMHAAEHTAQRTHRLSRSCCVQKQPLTIMSLCTPMSCPDPNWQRHNCLSNLQAIEGCKSSMVNKD
jgi:hypothetical protein